MPFPASHIAISIIVRMILMTPLGSIKSNVDIAVAILLESMAWFFYGAPLSLSSVNLYPETFSD